jgi:rhamnosyltransferase
MKKTTNSGKYTVGVAIITYKDKKHLEKCLPPLINSPLKPKVLVFNSTSNDGTVEEAKRLGAEVLVIPRTEMNHGWAREISRKTLKTDIVVMMTPDAYAADNHMLEKLIAPIVSGQAAVAYARQIPKPGANIVSTFNREYNYPPQNSIKSKADIPKYGAFTGFCSDACTAYLNKVLDEIGGFRWVLSGEDAVAGAMIIKAGYKIAYVADAVVEHSHNYTPFKEFIRHFDTGMYRKQWHAVLDMGSFGDQTRGVSYARALLTHVLQKQPAMLPVAFAQLAMGWLGYRTGWLCYHRAPDWLYKKISPADFFWNSVGYKQGRWFDPAK